MAITLKPRPVPLTLLYIGGGLLGLLLLWLTLGNWLASSRTGAIAQAQTRLTKKYPAHEGNATVAQLETLSTKFGLAIAPQSKSTKPTEKDTKAFDRIQAPLEKFIQAQVAQTQDKLVEQPQLLKDFFFAYDSSITAIRAELLQNDPPRWSMAEMGRQTLSPSNRLVQLNRVLLYDALDKSRNERYQGAFDSVRAARRLSQSLSDRSDLQSHLMALQMAEEQAGVLRQLSYVPPDWKEAIPTTLSEKTMLSALEFANWQQAASGMSQHQDVLGFLLRPFYSLTTAQTWEQRQQLLAVSKDICTANPGASALEPWFKAGQQDLRWELTQKVQQVKTLANPTGQLPKTVAGIEKSTVCPSLKWQYEMKDGKGKVAIVNPPSWVGKMEYVLK
jgi:hypothetical protein